VKSALQAKDDDLVFVYFGVRAILHHALALDDLDLVVKLATDAYGTARLPNQRVVVVEGFDSESPTPNVPAQRIVAALLQVLQPEQTGEPQRAADDDY
jgi:hypothetical protein